MKKRLVKIAIFLTAIVGTNSCNESNLDLKPLSPTEDTYFTTELEFTKGVYAIYSKKNAHYAWNGGTPCCGGNNPNFSLWQLPGDDMTTSGDGDITAFESFGPLQNSNGVVSRYFQACYEIITRANILLEKNAADKTVYTTENLKNIHRGEALFLRSLEYFNLWNFFGKAPLVTKRAKTTEDTFAFPSTGTQLLDQAIIDLEEAANLLPAAWDETQRGRVTKNAANALLGKIYLFRGTVNKTTDDLTKAIAAFDKISGVSLVSNFGDNFAFDTENNSESLFEYQASNNSAGDNIWLPNEFDVAIGSMSTSSWIPFEGINSWGYGNNPFIATTKLRDAFEADDPRLPLTLDPVSLSIKKYVTKDQKIGSNGASVNNPRILRLADVKLMKAEALLFSGGSKADAIALINEVRTRARQMVSGGTVPANLNTTETSDVVIFQWISDERFRELAFEEGARWLDLRRWYIAGKLTATLDKAFFASKSSNFKIELPKHLVFPIPLSETDRNVNMSQNDEY